MKKRITAAELMAELNADPKFVAAREKEEEERQRRHAEYRKAEAPLVKELHAAGFAVDTAWDLVNTTAPYPEALSILLEHLGRPYPGPVLEGIARALAVPEARFGWPVLIARYQSERNVRAKDGLAVAISAVADEDLIDDVIALVRDERQGPSRVLLLDALDRSKDRRAHEVLREMASDPDLEKEIRFILRKTQSRKR